MVFKLQDLNNIRVLRLMAHECSVEDLSGSLQKLQAVIEERREEERLLREGYMKQNEKIKCLFSHLQADSMHPAGSDRKSMRLARREKA